MRFSAIMHIVAPSTEHHTLKHICGIYALVGRSLLEKVIHNHPQKQLDFWNEGNGLQLHTIVHANL